MITSQVETVAPSYHKVIQCGPAQERHVFKQHGFQHLRQFLKFVPGKRYLLTVLPESEVHSFLKGYLDGISPYAYNSPPLLYLDPFLHIFSSYNISRVYVGITSQESLKKKSRKTITTSAAAGLRVPVKAYCVPPPLTILDSPFCFWWPGLPGRVAQVIIPEICPLVIIPFPYWVCCTCPFTITTDQGSTKGLEWNTWVQTILPPFFVV